jgi:hypothetical protein
MLRFGKKTMAEDIRSPTSTYTFTRRKTVAITSPWRPFNPRVPDPKHSLETIKISLIVAGETEVAPVVRDPRELAAFVIAIMYVMARGTLYPTVPQ